jgi:oxygen-independent coproporphyrinogen-3 oxidase
LLAYQHEIDFFAARVGQRKVKTIFFGGGTPSLMPIFLVEEILKKISSRFNIDENCEITLEANPTSFEAEKFKDLKKIGINRLSLGIQALNDQDLQFLKRNHSAKESIETIEKTAKIFDNFSFDLIYARPNQTLKNWQNELEKAISFNTKHLSLYQLTIEKGTQFFSQYQKKEFILPDENLSADFYQLTNQITAEKGFINYEISNYGKKNFFSRHNLRYWQSEDYIGIGAGAHSRVYFTDEKNKSAIQMISSPDSWMKKAISQNAGIQKIEKIDKMQLLEEIILMGLRLEEGIDNEVFLANFNKNLLDIFDEKKLKEMQKNSLIIFDKNSIKIAKDKKIISNSIISKILTDSIK